MKILQTNVAINDSAAISQKAHITVDTDPYRYGVVAGGRKEMRASGVFNLRIVNGQFDTKYHKRMNRTHQLEHSKCAFNGSVNGGERDQRILVNLS